MKTTALFFGMLLMGALGTNGQGGRWEDSLTLVIETARTEGLPVAPLENKIREGRAKGRSAGEIFPVVRTRRALLRQIKAEHNGTVSGEYMHDLFERERAVSARMIPQSESDGTDPKMPEAGSSVNRAVRKPASGSRNRKAALNSGDTEGHRGNADYPAEMRERKVERSISRQERKAEKRMEAVKKRMRKRLEKRHGREK